MKSFALVTLLLAACGGSHGGDGDKDMGPKTLGDAFVSTQCASDTECSADSCSVAKCNALTHQCTSTAKSCTPANGCMITADTCVSAMCDSSSGAAVWNSVPMAEGQTCTINGGSLGTCTSGTCVAIPSCVSQFGETVSCESDANTFNDSTDPSLGDAMANVSSYACAPTEAGAEVSAQLMLDPNATTPQNVTLTLQLQDDEGNIATNQSQFDLDLIVLQDDCIGSSKCMNPALTAGGFQGVTAGTSAETVTFTADPMHSYYVVVDGKDLNQISNFIVTVTACGACATGTTPTLGCNTSFPVNGDTSTGMSLLTSYMCGPATPPTQVALAGHEIPYVFHDSTGAARSVTATLTATDPSKPATVLVLSQGEYSDCEASNCLVSQATDPTSGVGAATFTTDGTSSYYFVVDTVGTIDSQFGLSVSCAPYCTADDLNDIDCDFNEAEADGTTSGTSQASQWGPIGGPACGGFTNLAGPEDVIEFVPPESGAGPWTYTLTLASTSQNLSFIVLDGLTTGTTCSPNYDCADFTPTTTASSTGRLTTDVLTDPVHPKNATATLQAYKGHNYYIVVDGTSTTGDSFSITAAGITSGAGCGSN